MSQVQLVASVFQVSQLDEKEVKTSIYESSFGRVLFVGRSNVGKSSLINSLLRQSVAYTSKKPGKTRGIHFFKSSLLKKMVVDLPGYGFSLRSTSEMNDWKRLINEYLKRDLGIERVLVLVDSKVGPTELDLAAIEYFLEARLNLTVVFTKWDRLKRQADRDQGKKRLQSLEKEFDEFGLGCISVSSQNGHGIPALKEVLTVGK